MNVNLYEPVMELYLKLYKYEVKKIVPKNIAETRK